MANGKYIVVEGISGVGKSVIIERLARELQAAQIPVQIMTDGRNTLDITAQAVQRIIDDPRYPMSSRAEVLLYNAAHSLALEDIKRKISADTVCITDYSYLTTLVTEYYGRGDITDYAAASQIIQYAAGDVLPDLLLLLDAPVSAIKGRLGANQQNGFDESYQERIRAGYLWEAKQRNLPIVYATDPIDTVLAAAWKLVSDTVGIQDKDPSSDATNTQSVAEVLAANPPTKAAPVEPPITTPEQASHDSPTNPDDTPDIPTPEAEAESLSEPPTTLSTDHDPQKQKHENTTIAPARAGKSELGDYVTNTKGSVYGFTDTATPTIITAALARSSHSDGDIRVALLDELASNSDQKVPSLQRAITRFGNSQTAQFTGRYMVAENASRLLATIINEGSLTACLELASHSTDFSRKDANGHYKYVIPSNLKGKPRSSYIRTMNQIFDIYAKLVVSVTAHLRATSTVPDKKQDAAWRTATKAQACSIVRPLLPVATATAISIHASDQTLENLGTRLLSSELHEIRNTGRQLQEELHKIDTSLFTDPGDKANPAESTTSYRTDIHSAVHSLASDLLPANYTAETKPVTLVGYTPRNELDIVADILYEHSDLPLQKILQETASWPYSRKADALAAYIGNRLNRQHIPGRALDKVNYSFDLISDFDTFSSLQGQRLIKGIERQVLSPRLGYDVPELVDAAGTTEAFEQCFDLSLQLYSELQATGFTLEAQYATLLGHKLRWKATYDARVAFQLLELPVETQGAPGCRRLIQQMYAEIAEVHSALAGAMRFVDTTQEVENYTFAGDSMSRRASPA